MTSRNFIEHRISHATNDCLQNQCRQLFSIVPRYKAGNVTEGSTKVTFVWTNFFHRLKENFAKLAANAGFLAITVREYYSITRKSGKLLKAEKQEPFGSTHIN